MHDQSQITYQPSAEVIKKYADVLAKCALNGGKGVQPGEVVECIVPDAAKPLALALQNAILEAGGHPMIRLLPSGFDRDFYRLANEEQLTFFPEPFYRAKADLLSHHIAVIADVDPFELEGIDPEKIIVARDARRPYRDFLRQKEVHGQFTWTVGLWGTQAKADIVGLTLEEYWAQIIEACFLDYDDPVAEWRALLKKQEQLKQQLNEMKMAKLHVVGPDVDLEIQLGEDRIWQGGSGHNIPSFEFFTSPDWRGTHGWIAFNQPVYRYGQKLEGVRLEFDHGKLVKATAQVGQTLLDEMFKSPNADKVGEFSLTDRRMSRITHTMAETLFDENISGPFGNTHIAVGMAYKDCYRYDATKLSAEDWAAKGFNDSAEHTDIVSTTDRTVTATLLDGTELVLYKDGCFTLY